MWVVVAKGGQVSIGQTDGVGMGDMSSRWVWVSMLV